MNRYAVTIWHPSNVSERMRPEFHKEVTFDSEGDEGGMKIINHGHVYELHVGCAWHA